MIRKYISGSNTGYIGTPNQIVNTLPYIFLMFALLSIIVFISLLMISGAQSGVYDILFCFIAPLYASCLVLSYIKRMNELSIGTIYFFCYSLLLGIPACYLFIVNDSTPAFKGMMLCIVLSSMVIYFLGKSFRQTKTNPLINLRLSNFFVFIFLFVAIAQLYKIYTYYSFISNSGLGHLAIYLSNDDLVSSVPFAIRFLSGFSVILSLMAIAFSRSKIITAIAIFILFSDIIIGIRGKAFSSLISIFIIMMFVDINNAKKYFRKITSPVVISSLFVVLSLVSYYREGYNMYFFSYLLIVLDSIASIISGLQSTFNISDFWYSHNFNQEDIILQFFNLLGFNINGVTPISQVYTDIALGSHSSGIALSSSLPLESMILGGAFGPMVMIAYSLSIILLINKLLSSGNKMLIVSAMAILPGFIFSCRAELVLPLVYLVKALPIIIISPVLIKRA
ncbi:TPA: O-antigen polymerase [Escherichia coli]|nr:hypothetical protein [Escherichia coli]